MATIFTRSALRHPPTLALLWLSCLSALFLASPALAQGESGNVCVRDYRGGAVCTANDVRIEALDVVSVTETCTAGTPGETEVVFEALVSSDGSPDRYDIGLFLALDGGSARDGDSCYHDFLSGALTATPTYGDTNMDGIQDIVGGPWWDGGTDGDSCGDIESNTQVFASLPSLRFSCIDNNGDGSADVSVCTSWDNNTGTACNTVVDAFPGTNSKCSCASVELGIPPAPEITVVKSPANQVVPVGGTASFTFTVTSRTTVTGVMVSDDPSCDTLTGPVGDTNNDMVLTPDETWVYSCDIDNVMADFMDTVTASGTGPLGPVMDTDTASVTIPVESPALGVAKRVTSITDAGGGQFDVAFEILLENLGDVALDTVQVTDDLDATFPAPVTYTLQAGPTASGTLTANGSYDGSADTDLLVAGSSTLAIGAAQTVTFTVRFDPNGASGPFSNSASGSGDSPGGVTVTDTSDDGTDPDPNGNGDPTEAGENDPTPVAVPEDPVIGVAKRVTGISDAGGGQLDVAFELAVENLGNVDLDTVQVTDDLDSTFPAPVTYTIQAGPTAGGTLTANGSYDGSADTNLLVAGSSSLAVGATQTLTFTVRITPNGAPGPFSNTAVASGDSPLGTTTTDTSDDGTDPDPDGDGDPTEAGEDDSTPVSLTEAPELGVAKRVTGVSPVGGDQYDVAFEIAVENLGNVPLDPVQVTDDLDATFPAPVTYTLQAGPTASGTLTANGSYDGSADTNLLVAGSSSLAIGATQTVTFTVRVTLNGATGPWSNQASGSGDSPGGATVSDTSDDGADPDPDGDGDPDEPGENDPTPVEIDRAVIGLAKRVTSVNDLGGGQFDIGLELRVENLGTVPLTDVQVVDDLDTTFPAPVTYTLQAGPTASGTLTANGSYDGSTDTDLLVAGSSTLAVGASETLGLTVRITLNGATGPWSNTATTTAMSAAGNTSDTSEDGADPDPDGSGDPGDPGEDTPTVISVTAEPSVTATKASSFDLGTQDLDGSGDLSAGDRLTYTLVITNDGTADAAMVVLDDMPDAATALVVGTVTTTQGTVTSGNGAGDTTVQVDLGTLAAGGGSATITFEVTLDDPLPEGTTEIVNQGVVSGGNFTSVVTDDPSTGTDDDPTVDVIGPEVGDPTDIPTLSEWMLLLLTLLLAGAAGLRLRRQRVPRGLGQA